MTEQMLILPSIALGLAIGAYEAMLMYRDVQVASHKVGHAVHSMLLAVAAVFITMNTEWFLATTGLAGMGWYTSPLLIRIAVGIVMAAKIHGVSQAIKGSGSGPGLGETWAHSILIGGLCIAAPYAWPFLKNVMPTWLGGGK
jgi:hypothetical protein